MTRGIFKCKGEGCPSPSCIRLTMKSPVELRFETYKPDTSCLFYLGPGVWGVLRDTGMSYEERSDGITV